MSHNRNQRPGKNLLTAEAVSKALWEIDFYLRFATSSSLLTAAVTLLHVARS